MAYVNKSDIYKLFDESNGVIRLHIADVDMLPIADVQEVVRCGECKHKGWVQEPCHGKTVDFCRIHETCIEKTDYCSYGEKKNDFKESI